MMEMMGHTVYNDLFMIRFYTSSVNQIQISTVGYFPCGGTLFLSLPSYIFGLIGEQYQTVSISKYVSKCVERLSWIFPNLPNLTLFLRNVVDEIDY